MAQRLKALAAFPEVLSSIPSNPCNSQPSLMRYGALFWHAGRTLYIIIFFKEWFCFMAVGAENSRKWFWIRLSFFSPVTNMICIWSLCSPVAQFLTQSSALKFSFPYDQKTSQTKLSSGFSGCKVFLSHLNGPGLSTSGPDGKRERQRRPLPDLSRSLWELLAMMFYITFSCNKLGL